MHLLLQLQPQAAASALAFPCKQAMRARQCASVVSRKRRPPPAGTATVITGMTVTMTRSEQPS